MSKFCLFLICSSQCNTHRFCTQAWQLRNKTHINLESSWFYEGQWQNHLLCHQVQKVWKHRGEHNSENCGKHFHWKLSCHRNSHRNHTNRIFLQKNIFRSIDQSLCPTGHMPQNYLRLWGFLCVRDTGCRGRKITVIVMNCHS